MISELLILARRVANAIINSLSWAFQLLLSRVLPAIDLLCRSAIDSLLLILDDTNRARFQKKIWQPLVSFWLRIENRFPERLRRNRAVQVIVGVLLLLLLFSLGRESSIDDLIESGELVVISRESPTTVYQEDGVPAGPEYDYLKSFAEYLGVKLRVDIRDNNGEVLDAINENEGHIAAAGMTYFPPLEKQGYVFGPGYQEVDVKVVCRRNHGKMPRNMEDLEDKELVVVADSSYESLLFQLQQEHEDLSWDSSEDLSVDDLLQLVWRKEIDCTIANSSEINIKRRYYPELSEAFTLQENQNLAWNLSPEWEILSDSIEQWLSVIENDGRLLILRDRHYKVEDFDYVDMRTFIRRMKSRLPKLQPVFQQAAEKYGLPWTLLAAQAYQESHWNRRAKSPTGVRGIMMLTLTTAKEMGVESRLDATQSIMGGARYLSKLEKRVPESVTGDDRWWSALAAYNVGMGHLHDARKLARTLDLNPDSWLELKGVLPLLSQKKYYKDLRYGYARGTEPVTYVRQIRNYQNIMLAQFARRQGAHID
ncbi:MAG: membrane-bound lytic murein transglycosylase MltF [Pseudomonadota bacterium]